MTTGELIEELKKYPPDSGIGYLLPSGYLIPAPRKCAPVMFTALRTTTWRPPQGDSVTVECVVMSDEELAPPKNP